MGEDHGFVDSPIYRQHSDTCWTAAEAGFTPQLPRGERSADLAMTGYPFNFVNRGIDLWQWHRRILCNTGVTNPKQEDCRISISVVSDPAHFLGTAYNRPQSFAPIHFTIFRIAFPYLKGKHTFKIGGEYTKIEADGAI